MKTNALAAQAFAEARRVALRAGLSVTERHLNSLVEIKPSGERREIKKLPPLTRITRRKFQIN